MFTAGSANWITVKGKRVTSKEAPIIVGAPHTSFFDALVVLTSGPATVVGKVEAAEIPFYGSEFTKNIFESITTIYTIQKKHQYFVNFQFLFRID